MPGWFITAIVLFAIALLIAAVSCLIARDLRAPAIAGAVVVALLGVGCTVIASYDRVDTRNVGIVTAFGRPVASRGAGIAWHAPWQKMSELSEAIQLQAFEGNGYNDPGTAIKVRLANNSASFVEENLNWRLREGAAPKLFQDYGGSSTNVFDQIKQNLVDRQAQVALSKVFATFDPTAAAQGVDLPTMAAQVKKDLQDAVGEEIEILDVRIPGIFYDDPTQTRIDQHNQKVQETKNAAQDVLTATQQRLASEQRAAQAAPDLKVAIFNCINDQVKNGREPAGCWNQVGAGGNPLIQIPVK